MTRARVTLTARDVALIALFLLVVPAVLHWRFSWIGFNPTDEGFILASSRRLLEGQVPHRDFIAIRPVGSPLLHLPEVYLGGAATLWWSRLVFWLEVSASSLAWAYAGPALLGLRPGAVTRGALALVATLLSAHYFPPMAWHTVDGLFAGAVGLVLCLAPSPAVQLAGYAALGLAPLFKQNFFTLLPVTLVVLGDARRIGAWLAGLAPLALYALALVLTGALPDAVAQLTSQTDVLGPGVRRYLWEYALPWGALVGVLAMRALAAPAPLLRASGVLALYALVAGAAVTLTQARFLGAASFGLVGAAAGATLALAAPERRGGLRFGVLALATAWTASISIGYNTPALATGPLALLLLCLARWRPAGVHDAPALSRRLAALDVLLVALTVVSFGVGRDAYVYQDRSAAQLTRPVGEVFAGGARLMTSDNTYEFLADLRTAVARAGGGPYAIVPDLAAYWITAAEVNPLPIDWTQSIELHSPALLARVTDAIAARRGRLTIIVQKVEANVLAAEIAPLPDSDHYAVVRFVRHNMRKVDDTRFFELYR
jgi:hypothetical protein